VIESDNINGGRLAARELLSCGCSSLAVIHHYNLDLNQRLRLNGFQQVLAEAANNEIHCTEIVIADGPAAASGSALLADLGAKPGIDGIFCLTDMIALESLSVLQQMNIKVPSDVCLIGFDDAPLAELWLPPLTTIRQNAPTMARLAASQLLAMIAGTDPGQQHNVVPVELVRRATTHISRNTEE